MPRSKCVLLQPLLHLGSALIRSYSSTVQPAARTRSAPDGISVKAWWSPCCRHNAARARADSLVARMWTQDNQCRSGLELEMKSALFFWL